MTEQISSRNDSSIRLNFREKLCYGLGDISNGLATSSVILWFLIYLTDVAGLSPKYAGIAMMIGRGWDAVTDPLMGWITDHTNSRWGKRRPYLLFGAIPYALSFFALWVVPEFDSEVLVFAYVTVTLLIFNTCLTVVFVPYTTLTAAITNDYDERTSLTGFRITSAQAAFCAGAAIPSALVVWVTSENGDLFLSRMGVKELFGTWATTPRAGYLIVAAIFAVMMVAAILITFFGTKERDIDTAGSSSRATPTPLSYASSILDELQGNRPFRVSVSLILLTNCAASLMAINLPYYLQYVLYMKANQTGIVTTLFITATCSVPIWAIITKKFGKAETYKVAMLLYAIVLFILPLIDRGEVHNAYSIAAAIGFFYAAALMIPWAIIPDVVEYDELKTGHRREGLFYGGTTFSYKLATALAIFASGWFLEWIGYVAKAEQEASVITGIKLIIGPAPALILILGAYIATKYPLSAEKHARIVEELAERNSKRSQV